MSSKRNGGARAAVLAMVALMAISAVVAFSAASADADPTQNKVITIDKSMSRGCTMTSTDSVEFSESCHINIIQSGDITTICFNTTAAMVAAVAADGYQFAGLFYFDSNGVPIQLFDNTYVYDSISIWLLFSTTLHRPADDIVTGGSLVFTKSDGTDSTEWTGDATVYSTYKYEVSDDGSISFYDTAFPMFAHNRFTMSVNPNDGYHPGTFFLGADAVTGSDYLSAGKTVKHVFTTDVEVYQPVGDSASKTGTLAGVHVCLTLAVAACAVAACAVAAMRLRRNRTLYR